MRLGLWFSKSLVSFIPFTSGLVKVDICKFWALAPFGCLLGRAEKPHPWAVWPKSCSLWCRGSKAPHPKWLSVYLICQKTGRGLNLLWLYIMSNHVGYRLQSVFAVRVQRFSTTIPGISSSEKPMRMMVALATTPPSWPGPGAWQGLSCKAGATGPRRNTTKNVSWNLCSWYLFLFKDFRTHEPLRLIVPFVSHNGV